MNTQSFTYKVLRLSNSALIWMIGTALLTFAFVTMVGTPSHAQSTKCRSLQSQLSRIETGRGAGNSRQFRRYDRAVRDQTIQIRKTERAARRNACHTRRSNKCLRINNSLRKMQVNLAALQRTRAKYAPHGTQADRAKIIRAIKRNRCGESKPQTRAVSLKPPKADRRKSLLEQIFGNKTYTNEGAYEENPESRARIRGSGTFRTLCVRTCDGYYFPISFSTSKKRFENDLEQCEQMCPGTETALFYHPMPGGDAETSISYRTGREYTSMENAFSYRKKVNSQCTCHFKGVEAGFEEIAGASRPKQSEVAPPEPEYPIPTFRKDIALSEDTLNNIDGGMTVEMLVAIANGDAEKTVSKRNIRIVGPAFFPVQ